MEKSDADIAERMRWARRQGHPLWPWPELQPTAWRSGLERIEAALRSQLRGEVVRLERPARDGLGVALAAFSSGTGALLGRWWEEGALETDPELGAALLLHLDHGRRRWLRLRAVAAGAIDLLARVGFSPIVLKGVHTAAAFFPEPGCRPCNDVDLAVPARDWNRAVGELERAGYEMLNRQAALGRAELLPPGEGRSLRSLYLLHADAPIRVDVHAGLDRDFFGVGRVSLGEPANGETSPWPALHPAARVLREPLLLVTLAAHASEGLHNLTMIRLYELVEVVRTERARGALDWKATLGRIGRSAYRYLFPALELTERMAPGTVPADVRTSLRAESPPALRRVVDGLVPSHAQRVSGVSLAERLMWVGSPGELIGRLAEMARPSSAGGSWSSLGRIYAERAWRVLRGHVSIDG